MDQSWVWSYCSEDRDPNIGTVAILARLALSIQRRERRPSCRKRLADSEDRCNSKRMRSSVLRIMKPVTYPQMKVMHLETNNENEESARKDWAGEGPQVSCQSRYSWERLWDTGVKKGTQGMCQQVHFRWTEEDQSLVRPHHRQPHYMVSGKIS